MVDRLLDSMFHLIIGTRNGKFLFPCDCDLIKFIVSQPHSDHNNIGVCFVLFHYVFFTFIIPAVFKGASIPHKLSN